MRQFQETPGWNNLHRAGMAQSHEDYLVGEAKKIAQYNPHSRRISFSSRTLFLPDNLLQRIIAHEMATDTCGRAVVIPYQDLEGDMRQAVDHAVALLQQNGIDLKDDLSVAKTGYMSHLLSGGFLVAQLSHPEAYIFDEIYPTIFEMISGELMKIGGSEGKFQADIRKARLRLDKDEEHPNFVRALFESLQYVNWKDLLHAYRQSDYMETIQLLERASIYGRNIFVALYDTMEQDEKNIESVVRTLKR